jgi:outer membrane protein
MRTTIIKSALVGLSMLVGAHISSAQAVLDDYINQALSNNIVLQQRSISMERAMLSLKIANGMFLPSVALQGNYTTGDGGRSIAIPIGDLLNPVYSTLNTLTNSDQFPQVENVSENFFPRNFYDVKARASMPIFNTDLVYNRKIQRDQVLLQEFEITTYKRELVRNVKESYFNYLSAREGVRIYQSALTRAGEGKRVSESLLANGKGLPAYVLRAESEIESIKSQILSAERQEHNAKMYFNFLLNRQLEEEIKVDTALPSVSLLKQEELSDIQKREELKQLQTLVELNTNVLKMKQSFWSPRVGGFVDIGAQAQDMKYNQDANYYLVGLQVDVPLFAGFTNRHKITQAKLDVKNAELSFNNVRQQLGMSGTMALNSLVTAHQNYQSAQKQLEAVQSYQKLIDRGYREGVNTFIEDVDARNQLTSAQLLLTINYYKVLTAEANYERESATYNFK